MNLEGLKDNKELFKGNNWTLPTDIELVEPAKMALFRVLEQEGWKREEVENFVELVFGEALVNAIAHGNLGIAKTENDEDPIKDIAKREQDKFPIGKKIFINISADKEKIHITIRDEGRGFDFENSPDPTDPENILKGSGRGLLFMREYSDSLTYSEGGREVTITKTRKEI